jgi:hypothetical protein
MKVQQRVATDVLVRDGETAVLLGDIVVRLGELSSVLYALCEGPIDVRTLAQELESRFGAPADRTSLRATTEAVTEMVRAGVLLDD